MRPPPSQVPCGGGALRQLRACPRLQPARPRQQRHSAATALSAFPTPSPARNRSALACGSASAATPGLPPSPPAAHPRPSTASSVPSPPAASPQSSPASLSSSSNSNSSNLSSSRSSSATVSGSAAGGGAAEGSGGGGNGGGGACSRRAAALSLSAAAASPLMLLPALTLGPAAARAAGGGSGDGSGGGGRFTVQPTSPAGQEQLDRAAVAAKKKAAEGGEAAAPRRERRPWVPVPLVPLAADLRVSKVIRGCWQLSGRHTGDPESDRTMGGDAVRDLATFHRAGITSLDTADNYGPSEALIGQYLRLSPWESSSTVVATKLSYVTEEEMAGVSRAMVEYAVRGSLAKLGVGRLELVQLQWADTARHRRWLDVLKWLADLREEGLIGHIGLCNFSVPYMAKAAESGVGLVSNQVQFSLVDRRPQLFMQKAAASYGIKLLAYGTLAGGLLADKYYGVPPAGVRLDTASKSKYGLLLKQAGGGTGGAGWAWLQEVLEAARTVAARRGVSAAAVATAWVLHQPGVAAAIVGARNARHVRDMQAACALTLDDDDLLDLDAVWEGVPQPPSSDVYMWERGGQW